jgi:hypothetical protein
VLLQIPEGCVLRAATMAAEFEKAVSNRNELKATGIEDTPNKRALVDCKDVTRAVSQGQPNERALDSSAVSGTCSNGGTCNGVFKDKPVQGSSVEGFRVSETSKDERTKADHIVINVAENTVGHRSGPSSSDLVCISTEQSESASGPEDLGKSQIVAKSALRGLVSSIEDAVKPDVDPVLSMALLIDIQKQLRAQNKI